MEDLNLSDSNDSLLFNNPKATVPCGHKGVFQDREPGSIWHLFFKVNELFSEKLVCHFLWIDELLQLLLKALCLWDNSQKLRDINFAMPSSDEAPFVPLAEANV